MTVADTRRTARHAAPPKTSRTSRPRGAASCASWRSITSARSRISRRSRYHAAGLLAPMATVVVVLVTLFAALPVYLYVAGRSPHGGGAVALLERLVPGWRGKLLILILLGFTATDFVFTRTFSAAAAAEHLIHNPQPAWQDALDRLGPLVRRVRDRRLTPVRGLAAAPRGQAACGDAGPAAVQQPAGGAVFPRVHSRLVAPGGRRGRASTCSSTPSSSACGIDHPDRPSRDRHRLVGTASWPGTGRRPRRRMSPQTGWSLAAAAFGLFPKLALGLSGFELTMIVMPLVRGDTATIPASPAAASGQPAKCSSTAAVLGSVALIASATVTSLLIPPEAFYADGRAAHRALAYLAHGGAIAGGEPGSGVESALRPRLRHALRPERRRHSLPGRHERRHRPAGPCAAVSAPARAWN